MFNLSSRLYTLGLLIVGLVGSGQVFAQNVSRTSLWMTLQQRSNTDSQPPAFKFAPARYSLLALDETMARTILKPAPGLEGRTAADNQSGTMLLLPLPDGAMLQVRLVESSVMAPELAQRYPQIKTYQVLSDDLRTNLGVADLTEHGFHAMFSTPRGTVFIDPRSTESGNRQYISYYKHDYYPAEKVIRSMLRRPPLRPFTSMPSLLTSDDLRSDRAVAARSGGQITTYRLALAATGEYTSFHGNATSALHAMATTLNRVNAIYQRDLAVRMELVNDNDLLIYTNAETDPYTPNDAETLLTENQANLDLVIGNSNYDIGHVFSTEGSGLASLGVVCWDAFKGQGETGSPQPINDPFDVDYVAHEMGHQFGASHTFNGTTDACGGGNRSPLTAFEPGSGSTIMGYAGICGGENLQWNSDAAFHAGSISEINTYLGADVGATCGQRQNSGNAAPVALAGSDFTIPKQTPFLLTGSANDIDASNSLTYAWEEVDLGTASTSTNMGDDGFRPLFRSFLPSESATRYFPKLASLLSGTLDIGERLPTTGRNLKFRLTVRDGAGGVADDDVTLTVDGTSGPFRITSPNGGETINGSTNVTWDVAGTDLAPVSCSHVNIGLSTDGGLTQLSDLLASNVPNMGSASVNFPTGSSNTTRIRIQCANNIFFDLSDGNFSYARSGAPSGQTISFGAAPSISVGVSGVMIATASSNLPVSYSSETPNTCTVSGSLVTGVAAGNCTIIAIQSGNTAFAPATPTSQDLTVLPPVNGTLVTRYRLYNGYTKEHLYTTDAIEYSILPSRGWDAEGSIYRLLKAAGSIDGIEAKPYYRLYNPFSFQHHWTTDLFEYNYLGTVGWSKEGIDGYIFDRSFQGAIPLYRLYLNAYGGLHLWTMDLSERTFLITNAGWIDEGISGFVVPLQ